MYMHYMQYEMYARFVDSAVCLHSSAFWLIFRQVVRLPQISNLKIQHFFFTPQASVGPLLLGKKINIDYYKDYSFWSKNFNFPKLHFFGFYSTEYSILMRIFCNMYSSLWKRLKNICSDEKSCFYHFLLQKYTILKLYTYGCNAIVG